MPYVYYIHVQSVLYQCDVILFFNYYYYCFIENSINSVGMGCVNNTVLVHYVRIEVSRKSILDRKLTVGFLTSFIGYNVETRGFLFKYFCARQYTNCHERENGGRMRYARVQSPKVNNYIYVISKMFYE